jgi:hypothetical protein
MTHAESKRRGHGEDWIYWDESRNRYITAVDLGFSPAGTRIRKKVSAKTKVEVRSGDSVVERTVQIAHDVLVRAIRHAEREDLVRRNVAALVDAPKGQLAGRPSKSLTLELAVALTAAAKGTALEAYTVVSLLSGVRTMLPVIEKFMAAHQLPDVTVVVDAG